MHNLNKIKILLIQPEVPEYRKYFFSKLNQFFDLRIVHSGKEWTSSPSVKQSIVHSFSIINIFNYQHFNFYSYIQNSNIVVINGNIRYISNLIILIISRILGKKVIWWGHLRSAGFNPIFTKIRHHLAKLASYRLFYTQYEAELYSKMFPKYNKTTSDMSNGLNIKKISALRKRYNPNTRTIDILFCGRLTTKSQVTFLLKAIKMIDQSISVSILGSGPISKSKEFKTVIRSIKNFSLIPETHNEELIQNYFNKAKLFVYPGSAGLSIIHAQSYGVPVLVHDNFSNHMPEISAVRDWNAGSTFIEGDICSLKQNIIMLLNNEAKLKLLSKNGIIASQKYFNADQMLKNFCQCIKSFNLVDLSFKTEY